MYRQYLYVMYTYGQNVLNTPYNSNMYDNNLYFKYKSSQYHDASPNIFSSCTAQKEDTQAVLTECEASGEVQTNTSYVVSESTLYKPILFSFEQSQRNPTVPVM